MNKRLNSTTVTSFWGGFHSSCPAEKAGGLTRAMLLSLGVVTASLVVTPGFAHIVSEETNAPKQGLTDRMQEVVETLTDLNQILVQRLEIPNDPMVPTLTEHQATLSRMLGRRGVGEKAQANLAEIKSYLNTARLSPVQAKDDTPHDPEERNLTERQRQLIEVLTTLNMALVERMGEGGGPQLSTLMQYRMELNEMLGKDKLSPKDGDRLDQIAAYADRL